MKCAKKKHCNIFILLRAVSITTPKLTLDFAAIHSPKRSIAQQFIVHFEKVSIQFALGSANKFIKKKPAQCQLVMIGINRIKKL